MTSSIERLDFILKKNKEKINIEKLSPINYKSNKSDTNEKKKPNHIQKKIIKKNYYNVKIIGDYHLKKEKEQKELDKLSQLRNYLKLMGHEEKSYKDQKKKLHSKKFKNSEKSNIFNESNIPHHKQISNIFPHNQSSVFLRSDVKILEALKIKKKIIMKNLYQKAIDI